MNTIITAEFHCAKCGKLLGIYKGEIITFEADSPLKNLKTVCCPSCDTTTVEAKDTKGAP
jgi:DNA-directed RNA polymerase subunit RPC12/RpoP